MQSTNMRLLFAILPVVFALVLSCKHQPKDLPQIATGYPRPVEDIIVNRCATSGCHNDQSKDGAAGLSLSTWENLFRGSRGGAVVIPYRPDYSTLLYYTNTDTTRGLTLKPTMPYNSSPLSEAEYEILRSWIAAGAPDVNGLVRFSDNVASRSMFFTANQGCDAATIFDAKSMLAMRVVSIGSIPGQVESAHQIKAAPNNEFFCVCYLGGPRFQKYSLSTFSLLGEAEIGSGSWNTMAISQNSKTAYTLDLNSGRLAIIDLESMNFQIVATNFSEPHGTALDENDENLYVTAQTGNFLYKLKTDLSDYDIITLDGKPQSGATSFDPHEIHFDPDYRNYFLTCQGSNEVRVLSRATNALVATIPVGGFPQEMGFSKKHPYLFVSCMEDLTTFPPLRGSVYVIDYRDFSVVGRVYTGHQPHGIAVDDANDRVYITNRNRDPGGPAPHHSSLCAGRNGYITAIDMNTLTLVPGFKAEVSVDPYGMGMTYAN